MSSRTMSEVEVAYRAAREVFGLMDDAFQRRLNRLRILESELPADRWAEGSAELLTRAETLRDEISGWDDAYTKSREVYERRRAAWQDEIRGSLVFEEARLVYNIEQTIESCAAHVTRIACAARAFEEFCGVPVIHPAFEGDGPQIFANIMRDAAQKYLKKWAAVDQGEVIEGSIDRCFGHQEP